MNTLKINERDKINKNIAREIAKLITEGKIVILPTSTIYGLSCKYDGRNEIEKIYKIKKKIFIGVSLSDFPPYDVRNKLLKTFFHQLDER